MQRIKAFLLKDHISERRVDVIPGIRVMAIAIIAWFHIWQQSWLSPYLRTATKTYDFLAIPRAGYLWVDMFILLSAFQLFLPHAKAMLDHTKAPSTLSFFQKRIQRITPSYYLSIVICLILALASHSFRSPDSMVRDILTHLTFTQTFFIDTYLWTNLNVVLWTVGILVQFYLVFPIMAKGFRKSPIITSIVMVVGAFTYRYFFVNANPDPGMYVNQFPAFLDVLALGMLTALAYVIFQRRTTYQYFSPLSTVLSIVSLILIYLAMKDLASVGGHTQIQQWQGKNRFYAAVLFSVFLFTTAYSLRWWRWLFNNKIMIFLASVSYNYYIWHQYIAVKLRAWHFPPSISDTPHMDGEKPWQYIFTACAFLIPLAFSILVTYLYDKPVGKILQKAMQGNKADTP